MSFLTAAPEFVSAAAGDLANIGSALGEAHAAAALPTTGIVAAAGDEVSAQIAAMFGAYGQQFQALNAQAAAFHSEFQRLLSASGFAYLSADVANAEQTLLAGGGAAAAGSAATLPILGGSGGLLGGLGGLLGGAASGGLFGGLTRGLNTPGGLFGGFGSLFGGLPTLTDFIGPINLGNLTPGLSLTGGPLGSVLNGIGLDLGNFLSNELANGITLSNLASIGTGLFQNVPPLPGALTGLENSLTGVVNSLLPGLVNIQTGAGPYFTGIAGPYEALVYNTWNNLNSLTSGWLADPFPFLRQFVANQMGYGQIIATALQTGNFQPIAAIPGAISHNLANVGATLTNTSVTSSLVVQELLPTPSLTLDNAVGLPLVFGASLLGPPAATLEAAGYSATAFASAVQAGNGAAAFAALVDAPAIIANGFLNGQATYPYALNLSSLTGPAVGDIVNLSVVANFPLDGILHPPGYYPVTATVTVLNNEVLPPIDVNLGVGSTPFVGLLPFLVNYAPQQLAHAIGAPA